MTNTSERIRLAMRIREMKQVDIVEKTGINKGALSCYLSGKYEPKQTNLHLIAKALNVNEAWLMGHDVPMERNPDLDAAADPVDEIREGYSRLTAENKEMIKRMIDGLLAVQFQAK